MIETAPTTDPLATLKAADSGGQERGGHAGDAWGDPASWSWSEPLRVACQLMKGNLGYWIRLALVSGAVATVPLLPLLVGPVLAVLAIGGAVDQLRGECDGTLSGTMTRWRPRILHCYLAQLIGGMIFVTMLALACVIPGASWAGIHSLAGPETAQSLGTVLPLVLLGMGLMAVGTLLVLRWTLFSALSVVVEGEGQLAALRGSARLVDGNWSGLLGMGLAIFSLGMGGVVVLIMVLFPLQFCWTLGVHLATESEALHLVLGLPMDFLAATMQMGLTHFFSISWTLIFLQQRARLRG